MRVTAEEAADLVATAHALADVARQATLLHFRQAGLSAENKESDRFDPVTVADRLSEERMREILAQRRPHDGIHGEEFGAKSGTSGLTWVLDPIDGTRGYLSGTPTWGVLIAVSDASGPIYGIIDQPYIQERFEGGLGRAEVNGPMGRATLKARPARALSEAILFSTFPEVGTEAEGAAFRRVSREAKLTRYGMDCYAYALLAAGQIDLVIEAGLQAYDVQAPIAVIEAAGGVVTDWQGNPVHQGGQVLAASSPELHAKVLSLLQG
ncbi:inositol monophosphatase family protein [Xinfangfangia sp. CPCC 101601]|uniref:Inositol monophosphatase family protein n=1 Tax=Pseudogemmobacter lacusdianii TaxID=3069608 RepID=A0ABU0VTK4_9RHOB|nr:inositol monophosphatase family protein [Xinfangfangia sp. CPCC 101601]MDQ2064873.1 inositol monophosphatase family protein [Xinfangfangia sp. CPCC 101601]